MIKTDKRLILMLTAAIIRVFPFGLKYFPQLDDYIQYGAYPNIENAYVKFKLFSVRPLAGIFDLYVWGRMWQCMWLALLIITVMHVASARLFMKTADKYGFRLGMIFAAVYLLFPLNIEAAYWISASSRNIVPMFFAALALYFLSKKNYTVFAPLQLISFLFYEQVFAFCAFTSVLLSGRDKRGLITTVANSVFVILYYMIFGSAGGRTHFTLFNKDAFFDIIRTWDLRGLFNFAAAPVMFIITAIIIGILFGKAEKQNNDKKLCIYGIAVFAVSYLPLLISGINGVAMRSAFVPMFGAAVILDNILPRYKNTAAAVAAAVFLISSYSNIDAYRENYINDRDIVKYVSEQTVENVPNVITNNDEYYINQGYVFKEHVKSIVSSDWAITGAVREYREDFKLPYYLLSPPDSGEYNVIDLGTFREEA